MNFQKPAKKMTDCQRSALKPDSKRRMFSAVAILLMLTFRIPTLDAQTNSNRDIQKQLEAKFKNTTLAIRHFFSGDTLKYDADGTLISGGKPGQWTINAYFEPQEIRLSDKSITISGKRIYWSFNDSKKTPSLFRESRNTTIEINRSPEQKDLPGILASLQTVFLKNDESLADLVPSYWKQIIQADFKTDALFASYVEQAQREQARREVTLPQLKYEPKPGYTEEARRARVAGSVVLGITIDEDGNAKVTDILKPMGVGMDESAIRTIEEEWKFSPAMLDGVPILHIASVEVHFTCYGCAPPP